MERLKLIEGLLCLKHEIVRTRLSDIDLYHVGLIEKARGLFTTVRRLMLE